MAGKVIAGITTSVDGYVTGPDDGPSHGLGIGGERLHYWVFGGPWTYESEREFGGIVAIRDVLRDEHQSVALDARDRHEPARTFFQTEKAVLMRDMPQRTVEAVRPAVVAADECLLAAGA